MTITDEGLDRMRLDEEMVYWRRKKRETEQELEELDETRERLVSEKNEAEQKLRVVEQLSTRGSTQGSTLG